MYDVEFIKFFVNTTGKFVVKIYTSNVYVLNASELIITDDVIYDFLIGRGYGQERAVELSKTIVCGGSIIFDDKHEAMRLFLAFNVQPMRNETYAIICGSDIFYENI